MPEAGTFNVEMPDIVILEPNRFGGAVGWVNVGAHALKIELAEDGHLTVRAHARGNEDQDLAVLTVTRERAVEAGGMDPDVPDDPYAEAAPAP